MNVTPNNSAVIIWEVIIEEIKQYSVEDMSRISKRDIHVITNTKQCDRYETFL